MNKWLVTAEIIDAYRVIPRILLVSIAAFVVWYTTYTTTWYFENFAALGDSAAMMYGSSGFLGVTIPAIFKFAIDYVKYYVEGGTNWKEKYELQKLIEEQKNEL